MTRTRLTTPYLPIPGGYDEVAGRAQPNNVTGAAWPAANRGLYTPFSLPVPVTVTAMSITVTSGTTGTYDLALYNPNYTAIVRLGPTNVTAIGIKTFTFTNPIRLSAGKLYFHGVSLSATNQIGRNAPSSALRCAQIGVAQEASVATLPATMTPASPASAFIPVVAFTLAGYPA